MKKMIPASRTNDVRHAVRDLVPIAQEVEASGKEVLYLNIGDPIVYDHRMPEHIWNAINERHRECEGYTDALGSKGARKAICDYAKKTGAHNVTPNDVISFAGGSEAILLMMQALLNKGDNLLVPTPGYSIYTGELSFLEAEARKYPLDEENDWRVDTDHLRKSIDGKTKGVVLINPNNPTGGLLNRKNLLDIVDIASEFELPIFSDETYDQLVLDGEFVSIASIAKDTPIFSVNSISKTYLAPGIRGGWIYRQDPLGVTDDYFEAIRKLCRLRLSNPGFAQVAIEAALTGPQDHLKGLRDKLSKRGNLAYKRLNEIEGLSCVKPRGAFYAFPKIEFPIDSDKDFVIKLVKEEGVLVVHGEGFGQAEGSHHFRIVFLPPEEILEEAFTRIERFIKNNYS